LDVEILSALDVVSSTIATVTLSNIFT